MDKKSITKLIQKYLSGQATPEEEAFLSVYDKQFEERDVSGLPGYIVNIAAKKDMEALSLINWHRKKLKRISWVYNIAASVIVLFALGIILFTYIPRPGSALGQKSLYHFQTSPGKMATLTLPDGTTVKLNAGSKIAYSKNFNRKNRDVYLDGEAFFDVAKRPSFPFIVQAGKYKIHVLGTTFNARSFSEDQEQEVAVYSGKVALQTVIKGKHRYTILNQHEKINFNLYEGALAKSHFESKGLPDWQKGIIKFKNTPFADAIRTLKRRYNIPIVLSPALADSKVYAEVGPDPADVTLRALAKVMNARLIKDTKGYQIK